MCFLTLNPNHDVEHWPVVRVSYCSSQPVVLLKSHPAGTLSTVTMLRSFDVEKYHHVKGDTVKEALFLMGKDFTA